MAVTKQELDQVGEKIERGEYTSYFYLPDFDKHSGGIQYVYNHVKRLNQEGFKAVILHTKTGYKPEWLKDWFEQDEDGNFVDINIEYLDKGEMKLNMEDFFFVPEGYPKLMDQIKNAPCKKIVFCLNWYYVLNALDPGVFWDSYNFRDCLSITQSQTDYLKMVMPFLNIKNVVGQIDNTVFTPPEKIIDKKMTVAFIPSRDGGLKSHNIIKMFYAIFPHLRFINFVEVKGMDKDTYAEVLRDSAFYVHFDEASSMGTAPLEAWLSGCLVAGWDGVGGSEFMSPKNTFLAPNGDITRLALSIGNMIEAYLMDDISQEFIDDGLQQCERYTIETERESILKAHNEYKEERIEELKRFREIAIDEKDVIPEVELPNEELSDNIIELPSKGEK